MHTYADKTQVNKSQSVANTISETQNTNESTFQFIVNRPEAISQRNQQEMANNSPQVEQLKTYQEFANNSSQVKKLAQIKSFSYSKTESAKAVSTPIKNSSTTESKVIQRKVGFEFETAIPVYANDKNIIAKNTHLYDGESRDWYATPDAGNLELVTEPFNEEGSHPEWYRMISAISDLRIFVRTLLAFNESDFGGEKIFFKNISGGVAVPFKGYDVYVPKDDELRDKSQAAPQVTGGVNVENIPKLMQFSVTEPVQGSDSAMANDLKHNTAIMKRSDEAANKYIESLGEVVSGDGIQSEKLKGLLSLVYVYLYSGQMQHRVQDQAKYSFPIMSRMNFLAIYSSLNTATQKLIDPGLVLSLGGLKADEPVYAHGFLDFHDKDLKIRALATEKYDKNIVMALKFPAFVKTMFGDEVERLWKEKEISEANIHKHKQAIIELIEKENAYRYGREVVPERGPHRILWLSELQKGAQDLMSSAPVNTGMYASSPSMGQHAALDPDHLGNPDQLIQIELRRLQKGVPIDDWLTLAMNLFSLFRRVQR